MSPDDITLFYSLCARPNSTISLPVMT